MNKKRWLLVLIVIFPSLFWVILETSTINSRKLPYYGPKTARGKGDTIYYRVDDRFYTAGDSAQTNLQRLDSNQFPLYAVAFIRKKYRGDAYRLSGLWEYLNYKNEKIEHIPIVLVTEADSGRSVAQSELQELSESKNVHFYTWPAASFDTLVNSYFKEKPYYIDYSFFLLIDAGRHVRGYYDVRYVSEMKRLIDEYRHLRLKEEKQKLGKDNEIISHP